MFLQAWAKMLPKKSLVFILLKKNQAMSESNKFIHICNISANYSKHRAVNKSHRTPTHMEGT